ncbi:MAG: imidazole glycerol phosphate synthase subunit HisH [Gammaproteobacteria bacterium]|nr:MAG: imidazole glycerol phosphate synthase subunit HisH [Gammaproteobacteria bacterium]
MQTVAVIDYGVSNLRSVERALTHVAGTGASVRLAASPEDLRGADRIVFPGQGAIGDCMRHMRERGLDQALLEAVRERPFLGLCLGLQSLLDFSEEDGGTPGFGLFPGKVVRFPAGMKDPATGLALKVPHMGWNQVWPTRAHPLWEGIEPGSRFYFVHSYYVVPERQEEVAATCSYGLEFACALARDNLFAVQFHPEKSQRDGLRLLANFLAWEP